MMARTDNIQIRPFRQAASRQTMEVHPILEENHLLREEIRVARQAADITADLVVKQFEETEKILHRFQTANAMRKAVLDSAAQMAIIATDRQGRIVVFNAGAENLLGYKAEEAVGRLTPTAFLLQEEVEVQMQRMAYVAGRKRAIMDFLCQMAIENSAEHLEWTFRRKDGSHFPTHMSINALRDADGTVSGCLFIATDISEQKRSEQALKESERNYRLLLRNLPNVVFKGYANGAIDFIDDKILALTGYNKEDFLSGEKKWLDIVVPEDLQYVRQMFIKALKTNKSYIREYRIRSKNGKVFWIEEGGQIICDEQGNIDFVIGAFLNITERKRAEKAMLESEEKYRSLFNSGPNPIVVLDRHTHEILDANPRALETFSMAKGTLIGKIFTDFGTFEYDSKTPARIDIDGWPEKGTIIQKLRDPKTGQYQYIKIKVSPTIYKGHEATILAGTDITEVMEKDAQLIQASKMTTLGEMSAGIAHELNQPLNTIQLGAEYLKTMVEQKCAIPEQDLLNVVGEINEQVARASDIINRLRAFGRKTDDTRQAVNLNDPVRGVLKMIGQQLKLEGIRIDLRLDENLPVILAQRNRLEQVLFNLISNARDAINKKRESTGVSAPDSKPDSDPVSDPVSDQTSDQISDPDAITIETFCKNNRAGVRISDTGTGIPKEICDRVFEPFFTTKDVGSGMGLGLSIIYGIIRDYGGDITMRSEEGRGTVFSYSFPCMLPDI